MSLADNLKIHLKHLPEILTAREVCGAFGISLPTLRSAVKNGRFTEPIQFGRTSRRWLKSSILDFYAQEDRNDQI